MSLDLITLNLLSALFLGALVGFERQWRQRLAGLRTNTLVSIGAASFVIFAGIFPDEVSPTRVAAQVVSGIGFLGAGIIFREGVNVRGLNTAATLWCSAAIGILCGAGAILQASIVAFIVVSVNLLLRPLVSHMNRNITEKTNVSQPALYEILLVCYSDKEAHIRSLLLHGLSSSDLHLRGLFSQNIEDSNRVEIQAEFFATSSSEITLEKIVGRLSLESDITSASWHVKEAFID